MSLLPNHLRSLVAAQLASGVMAANADDMSPEDAVELFSDIEQELVRRKWRPGKELIQTEPDA
ncbi:hypothetical protein [Niveispirillum sp.]|uniref:hypothetical protein n=1 Tax=Niveispirillum sp. TaxID=1917217 RepID=UPI001B726818|nr:hypothetical protein [Niveispirillum sp.]MBP7337692.1 hypothetical protein [Niveispirillum sp.]